MEASTKRNATEARATVTRPFFQSEIVSVLCQLEHPLHSSALAFAKECVAGGDGSLDIELQESGRGYYAHLAHIDELASQNPEVASNYKEAVLSEIRAAELMGIASHQMSTVRDQLE